MSTYRVFKEKIQLFVHPNSDFLELGKIGNYQVVVQKGLYKNGDLVVFAPEKSILTGKIKEQFQQYLGGVNKDRVCSIRLRNELSSGIILSKDLVKELLPDFDDIPLGVDIASRLGISKYVPKIPKELEGTTEHIKMINLTKHDCESFNIYSNEFVDNERIIITEKIHGTQVIIAYDFNTDSKLVTSKGNLDNDIQFLESNDNAYWNAVNKLKIFDIIKNNFNSGTIQIFGELYPFFKHYKYGLTDDKRSIKLFDVFHNNVMIHHDLLPDEIKKLWVPILYDGPIIFNTANEKRLLDSNLRLLADKKEQVSGKELHNSEGIVIKPYNFRRAKDGTPLKLKLLNKSYKETGEEFN